jgi:hypothetical protein
MGSWEPTQRRRRESASYFDQFPLFLHKASDVRDPSVVKIVLFQFGCNFNCKKPATDSSICFVCLFVRCELRLGRSLLLFRCLCALPSSNSQSRIKGWKPVRGYGRSAFTEPMIEFSPPRTPEFRDSFIRVEFLIATWTPFSNRRFVTIVRPSQC